MTKPKPVLARLRGSLDTLPDRFAAKVRRHEGEDACWTWTHSTNDAGYGQIDKVGAHRVAYKQRRTA